MFSQISAQKISYNIVGYLLVDAKFLEALVSERMKKLPADADRGNERELQLRTSNSCKNLDENK